jgi:hypothetical protein
LAEIVSRLWQLQPYERVQTPFQYCILTPEPISNEVIIAAWSYALRYTAQGLDLPDHEAALQLMLKRHSSWQAIEGRVLNVQVNLALADKDEPETG